jgi:hypothetical protein
MAEQMKIKIVAVESGKGTSKAGKPYDFLEVTYKNLSFGDKVENKKVMPFGSKEVFATLQGSKSGDVFTLQREKDNAGYWQWIGIAVGDVQIEQSNGGTNAAPAKGATPTPKSTYETPEERAKKQVYIVRQSSISAAIETLKTDKKNPTVEEVLTVARTYEDYVFGISAEAAPEKLPDVDEDDIPY